MKTLIRPVVALSILLAPAAPLELRVELSPKSTLPGLPVVVRLVVTNGTSQPQELPKYLVLRVKQDGQEPFLAKDWEGGFAFTGNADVVPAGKTIRKPWPVTPAIDSGDLLRDERLRTPGEYDLEFLMFREWPNFRPAAGFNAALDPGAPSLHATAALTINEPTGEDAKVWDMIQTFERDQKARYFFASERYKLAAQIRKLYPSSRYVPYLRGEGFETTVSGLQEQFCRLYEGLLRAMPDPFLRAQVALTYADELARWAQNGDGATAQEVVAHGARARDILNEIDRSWGPDVVPDDYVAFRIREIRGSLLSPDEYRERFREARE